MYEFYKKWLDNQPKIFCACGCGGEIAIMSPQKYYGKSNYIIGHHKKGKKISEEHKLKISRKDKYHSEESKEKMSDTKKNMSLETKQKISESKSGEKHPNWQDGKSFEPYCPKFNERKKEEIRNQYDRKCYICDKDEKDNKYKNGKQCKLSVHHIDSDKEQGCNGKQWKLVPLCLKCHNSKKMKVLCK